MKIEDLTPHKIVRICQEHFGCIDCPFIKRAGNIELRLCQLKIKDVKEMEINAR